MKLVKQLEKIGVLFLDTAPVIYFVEQNPEFGSKVQEVFERLDEGKLTAVVSPITLAECLVLPYKQKKSEIAQVFIELLANSESVLFYPIDEVVAHKAADLRARYNLTLTDAFQLAIAIQAECDAFLTNDADLKRVKEIPVLVLAEAE
jgi:predicted nucleic acid-binding protein